MAAFVGLVFMVSLTVGGGDYGLRASLAYLTGRAPPDTAADIARIVTTLRLPRATAGLLVGGALGLAGWLLQTATRNPLAEPGILGINAGAATAVVLGISLFGLNSGAGYLSAAFLGAASACALVLLLAHLGGTVTPLRLILAGAAIGASLYGVTAVMLTTHQLAFDEYRFWIQGALVGASPSMMASVLPGLIGALAGGVMLARPLSALTLGDRAARALGHRPAWIRLAVVGVVALASASAVALAGPIAFIGLLAPHVARWLIGRRPIAEVSASILAGAGLVLLADIIARRILAPYEAPVSAVVALLGAPAMIAIVRGRRSRPCSTTGSGF
ncbi:iron ABC transporter permease [Salinisphaera sp. Q1T1-3]|nr:iron ABC transporter permease [Salinisphaera sp. Q1T1-3]